ncbi:MAG: hypothetical protein M3Y80_02485 [Verrucomicrobiota bacterium]|nr:hypothetical protein [Verrucomicrobiota bacterium]
MRAVCSLSDSDREFLADFEACRVTAAEFGHRQHLRLAYSYLALHPFETAAEKTEAGLRRLLEHLGAPPEKYHCTQTHAWLRAVQHFMRKASSPSSFDDFLASAGALSDQRIMETHYTPARLFSDEARVALLPPDRSPFPG